VAKETEKRRTQDFVNRYANNVQFEASAWDLRLIFGQLDQSLSVEKDYIDQHTAMAIPWSHVKLMAYLLRVHVIMHEAKVGRVHVPGGLIYRMTDDIPPEFKEQFKEDIEAVWNDLRELYEDFVNDNPEAV
jgi:hypothetical protein